MKKGMRAILAAVVLLAVMVCSLTACGGSKEPELTGLEGNYIAVAGTALGITMTGDDMAGFAIELQPGGKVSLVTNGETNSAKWKYDDQTITITADGKDIVAKRITDGMIFENMLDMGMDITFAKEGTDAANPENYLPEDDKYMLGVWQSESVTDILGDPTDEVEPDALQLEFFGDHTVKVTFEGKEVGTCKWSLLGSFGSVDDENIKLGWTLEDDRSGVVFEYSEEYYGFYCPKAGAEGAKPKAAAKETEKETEAETEAETEKETEAETEAEKETEAEAEKETDPETEAGIKEAAAAAAAGAAAGKISVEIGESDENSIYYDYWDQDWYGWWIIDSAYDAYEDLEDMWWDCCAMIRVTGDDTGKVVLWDSDGSIESLLGLVDVSFGPGVTSAGCMKSEEGRFNSSEVNLGHADWLSDPGAHSMSNYENMICIDGEYEDEEGSFRYEIYLRPWGMDWEDVRAAEPDMLPEFYDSWYVNVKDDIMPDKIGS